MRSETWCAWRSLTSTRTRLQPAAAAKISGGQKTPCPLGRDGNRAIRAGGDCRCPHLRFCKPTRSALSIAEKSIAVLPFENLSEEKTNEFFADGVQDEILTNLAKIADLKVISRISVMQYKAGARNVREIGQQLGVAHVLEGSVQRAGGKVRVTAQLIDTRTDVHQWAEHYDRPLDDMFAIQSEIAKTIAGQLQVKLSPNEKAAIETPPTDDLAAFDLYTRGKTLLFSTVFSFRIKENLTQAVELFNQAIKRDPKFFWPTAS